MSATPMRRRSVKTPVGAFVLFADDEGLAATAWADDVAAMIDRSTPDPALLPDLVDRLERYIAGEPVVFDDVPTPPGRPFFRRCWSACRTIPPGRTRGYADLATMAGSGPGAARAAGQAMRRNPMPVIVPCHRVVAAGGSLHGYAGSSDPTGPSLSRKRYLLDIEAASAEETSSGTGGTADAGNHDVATVQGVLFR